MPYHFSPETYTEQLEAKVQRVQSALQTFNAPAPEVFASRPQHFRMRAEFRMWHDKDSQRLSPYPVMFKQGEPKIPYPITKFPIATLPIDEIVQNLSAEIQIQETLKNDLFQIELLSSRDNSTLLTLIYHRKLDPTWRYAAHKLQDKLSAILTAKYQSHMPVHIIGRSRKQKIVLRQDHIVEKFSVAHKTLRYKQFENSFTQSNADINEHMLNWVYRQTQHLPADALELYCGNGNFTAVLAQNFRRVFATEVVKSAVHNARENMRINKIDNCQIARLSSEEFTQALQGQREFRRLKDIELGSYEFSTVLVDPPRSGLDDNTCAMLQGYENILYISCNLTALTENLNRLSTTHELKSAAIFDQFPYTDHLECGVLLSKRA